MSRKCVISGKKPLSGNTVSHANNRHRRSQKPNMQYKRIYDPELGREVRLRLSTSALRSITRFGLMAFLRKKGLTLKEVM
ncbi:MAG: 50S ribosomal protein L28 [Spirochaetales bacterium]|nr:50S ribosomal protein L28 [Spirochaetales bacterium]